MLKWRSGIFILLFLITLMSIIPPTLTVANFAIRELIREGSSTGGTYTIIAITDAQNSPILLEPKNDTVYPIGVVLVFNWTSIENAIGYTLYIDISTYFNSSYHVKVPNLTSTHYSLNTNTLEPNHLYYWKVCALLSNDTIVSSDVFTFEVIERDNPLVGSIWTSLLVVAAVVGISLLIIRLRKYKSSHYQMLTALSILRNLLSFFCKQISNTCVLHYLIFKLSIIFPITLFITLCNSRLFSPFILKINYLAPNIIAVLNIMSFYTLITISVKCM